MDDMRAWRESECAEDPTAEESMAACLHRNACARLAEMYAPYFVRESAKWCQCDMCCEWEED